MRDARPLTHREGEAAVYLARAIVDEKLPLSGEGKPVGAPSQGYRFLDRSQTTSLPDERRGVFVTLRMDGDLRGCMGLPLPEKPLPSAVREAALNASFRDPRFPALVRREFEKSIFEVTVLTPPREIEPGSVEVGRHGLILEAGGRAGLLLPQVPVEAGWSREHYLDGLSRKAGLPAGAWKSATLKAFEGQVFREAAPGGAVEEG